MGDMDDMGRARLKRRENLANAVRVEPVEAGVSSFQLCASDDGAYGAKYMTLEVGTFHRRPDTDIIVYLLSGSVHVTADDGSIDTRIVPGEAMYLPRGMSAVWVVAEAAHKVVVSRVPVLRAVAS
ncbi:MAG: cupin domain-containing protein [Polyangia bacterium]